MVFAIITAGACSSSSNASAPIVDASSTQPQMTGSCTGFAKELTVAAIWTSSDILSGPFTSPNASGSYTSGEDAGAWPLFEGFR